MRVEGSPWRIIGRPLPQETGKQLDGCATVAWESGQPAEASLARRQALTQGCGERQGQAGLRRRLEGPGSQAHDSGSGRW